MLPNIKVQSLDWYENANFNKIKIWTYPAQHWSSRWIIDRDRALWGAFVIETPTDNLYFAGDTAQTIAKGVGARFSDLKTLFANFNTKVLQLTTNYRSHGQILALANSVVSLLETLFPFSIDSLAKEESLTMGLKPLILMPM